LALWCPRAPHALAMKKRPAAAAARAPVAKRQKVSKTPAIAKASKESASKAKVPVAIKVPLAAKAPAMTRQKVPQVPNVTLVLEDRMPATPTKQAKAVERQQAPKIVAPISLLKDGVLVQNRRLRPCHAVWETQMFEQGEFRYVYRGKYDQGERLGEECVRKEFKTGCVYESSFFKNDIKTVQKAAEILKKFNTLDLLNKPIYMIEPEVWVGDSGCSLAGQKMLVEPMIKGEYFKFNSNTGYAADDSDAMQALSHFSFHQSGGEFLLCDLQGGRYANCYILTDPVMHSRGKTFGPTDLGEKGINNFMAHHKCSRFCNAKWSLPAPMDLIPTFKAVSGTTFGQGVPVFSASEMQKLQAEVRKCWEKHLPKGTPGSVRVQLT